MTAWTEEEIKVFDWMTVHGDTASEIGDAIGKSRNAVCSRWKRTGIKRGRGYGGPPGNARPKRSRAKQADRRVVPRAPAKPSLPTPATPAGQAARTPASVPTEELVVPVSLNVSLLALNDQMCHWPIGDPGRPGFHFCGHRNYNNLPYCEYHSRLAYIPARGAPLRVRF